MTISAGNNSIDPAVPGPGDSQNQLQIKSQTPGRSGFLWLGLVAPMAIVMAGAIAVGRATGHRLQSDTFSDLAAQDAAQPLVMRMSIILFGLAMALFGYGLGASRIRSHRAVQPLVIGFGTFVFLSGIFRDHSELPNVRHNLEGNIHNASGIVAISLMIVAMLITAHYQFSRSQWSLATIRDLFLISGAIAGGAVFSVGPLRYNGAAEIVVYVAILAWIFTTALSALSAAETDPPADNISAGGSSCSNQIVF